MIKEKLKGVDVEISENPREHFWNDAVYRMKRDISQMENTLELTKETLKIAEKKLKECAKDSK